MPLRLPALLRGRSPTALLARPTWSTLLAYALVALVYLAFVRAPGPAWQLAERTPLALPGGDALLWARRAPRDGLALVGLRGADGRDSVALVATTWLFDPVLTAILQRAAVDRAAAPLQLALDDGHLAWLADEGGGRRWWRWRPPDAPRATAVPPGTLWVDAGGRAIGPADLPAPHKLADDDAVLVDQVAVLRLAGDDLLIAPRSDPARAHAIDTHRVFLLTADHATPGLFFTDGSPFWLEHATCDAATCTRRYERAPPTTRGGPLHAVDHDRPLARLAICTDRALHLYEFRPDDRCEWMLEVPLEHGCDAALVLAPDRALARTAGAWQLLRISPRGGWL